MGTTVTNTKSLAVGGSIKYMKGAYRQVMPYTSRDEVGTVVVEIPSIILILVSIEAMIGSLI